ncbi:hypothetical protein Hanom_Chr15g01390521 [Helianthus anomalus]
MLPSMDQRNAIGTTERDVEKKLRETGEWLIDQTDGPSGSSSPGKNILKVVFCGFFLCGFSHFLWLLVS